MRARHEDPTLVRRAVDDQLTQPPPPHGSLQVIVVVHDIRCCSHRQGSTRASERDVVWTCPRMNSMRRPELALRKGSLSEQRTRPAGAPRNGDGVTHVFSDAELEAFTARVRAERVAAGLLPTIADADTLDRIVPMVFTSQRLGG